MKAYTREELIDICEKAFVKQEKWGNRDSASAMMQTGKAYALLKAGCEYSIDDETDGETIWIQFYVHDFSWFEEGGDTKGNKSHDTYFYLPTLKRLKEVRSGDWY